MGLSPSQVLMSMVVSTCVSITEFIRFPVRWIEFILYPMIISIPMKVYFLWNLIFHCACICKIEDGTGTTALVEQRQS